MSVTRKARILLFAGRGRRRLAARSLFLALAASTLAGVLPAMGAQLQKPQARFVAKGRFLGRDGLIALSARVQSPRSGLFRWQIFRVGANGSGQRQLTDLEVDSFSPTFSPDGTQIAFSRGDAGGDSQLYLMNSEGGAVRQLTFSPAGESNTSPAWSPDGTRLAFVGNHTPGHHLYLINADGTGRRVFTSRRRNVGRPAWSRDGARILAPDTQGLYLLPVEAPARWKRIGPTDISPGPAHPAWRPDGRRIAFVRLDDCGGGCRFFHIDLMRSDGSDLHQLIPNAGSPSWSPDGRFLLYNATDGHIHALDVGSGVSRDVTPSLEWSASEPDWQPLCSVRGTPKADLIRPRTGTQLICSYDGNDRIVLRRGDNRVFAGAGKDRIVARNGAFDLIRCGPGNDTVIADRQDFVARDCEEVRRKRG